ncbi:MAG: hypothetical protein IGR93_12605 [Hydrococcus sp. C42_A2020_068]|nr:hypothetical protein [Hydrococcus sp. C42_A2020_068]
MEISYGVGLIEQLVVPAKKTTNLSLAILNVDDWLIDLGSSVLDLSLSNFQTFWDCYSTNYLLK